MPENLADLSYVFTGIGARRIDVTETYNVFNATTTYFRAGKEKDVRRAASIGPGVSYSQQYSHDLHEYRGEDDSEEVDWEDLRGRIRRLEPSTVTEARSRTTSRDVSRSNSEREPRHSQPQSARGSSHYQRSAPQTSSSRYHHREGSSYFPPSPPASRSVSTSRPSPNQSRVRPNRHTSVDGTQFYHIPMQDANPEEYPPAMTQLPPIPPYSPYPTPSPLTSASPDILSPFQLSPVAMSAATSPDYDGPAHPQWPAAQTLEEHRNSLHWSLENSHRYQSMSTFELFFVLI